MEQEIHLFWLKVNDYQIKRAVRGAMMLDIFDNDLTYICRFHQRSFVILNLLNF
jgi:hypothetical protein